MLSIHTVSLENQGPAADARAETAANTRSWQDHAQLIAAAWQKGVVSIIGTGQKLLDAKAELDRDVWRSLFQFNKLPFGKRTAQMLMRIAEHPIISNANHGSRLPPCWRSLAELTRLDSATLLPAIESGAVHSAMQRKDVRALLGKPETKAKAKKPTPALPSLVECYRQASEAEKTALVKSLSISDLLQAMSAAQRAELADLVTGPRNESAIARRVERIMRDNRRVRTLLAEQNLRPDNLKIAFVGLPA